MPKGDDADPTVRFAGTEASGTEGDRSREPTRFGHPIEDQRTILGEGRGAVPPGANASNVGPGATVGLSDFKRQIVETGLISDRELERVASESLDEVLALARALVKTGKLTAYQAAAVHQGKIKGLFIGNYVILDKLGAGGMGVVFKVKHRRLGRVVALKMLPPSFARDRDAVGRFRREVDVAAKLSHPNIVSALDADEDRGVHFLVMDYIEGRDLDRLVSDRGPLPVGQALDCIVQAARGLDAAHAIGIVHRDIKPGNLMLDASGTVRVLDLGLARVIDSANPFGQTAGPGLTQSGAYMGTVDFMAPEQADDSKRADHRADIYSLGCTLYFLLAGKSPFDGATVLKRLMAHQERPAPSLRSLRGDVSQALDAAYQKMMTKRPADRPQSMKDVIALLESARIAADVTQAKSGLATTFAERVIKKAAPPRTAQDRDPSVFTRANEAEALRFDGDLSLEDLVMDVRPEIRPEPLPKASLASLQKRGAKSKPAHDRGGPTAIWGWGWGVAGALALLVLVAMFSWWNRSSPATKTPVPTAPIARSRPAVAMTTIFDGSSPQGWMLDNGMPLLRGHLQPDGLNPRATRAELVVFEKKLGDFVLDFDYKLSRDCDTGVYPRVDHPDQPNKSGIEVSLSDAVRSGVEGTGGFWGLVAPRGDAQNATGEWNHMTITVKGSSVDVVLNEEQVAEINLDDWKREARRLESQDHEARRQSIIHMPPTGYIAFEYQRRDCWFKNIRVSTDSLPAELPARGLGIAAAGGLETIFDGVSGRGWILSNGKPLPLASIQDGRLNLGRTGSDQVAYAKPVADFVLDFDYKLSRGCNSGVFLRVGSLDKPVETGLEVQLHDGVLTGLDGSGGIFGLVAPRLQAQRPAGQWNHMTITADGPKVSVVLNGTPVSDINIDIFKDPARRPPRGDYNAEKLRALQALQRPGYVGFQDRGKDCWFKSIKLKTGSTSESVAAALGAADLTARIKAKAKATTKSTATSPGPVAGTYVNVSQFKGHATKGMIFGLAVTPDGRRALSGGADGFVRLWEIDSRRELHAFRHGGMVWTVAISPDGHRALSACHDTRVRYLDLDTGKEIINRPAHQDHAKGVAFFPDGARALSVGDDDVVFLWDLRSRQFTPIAKQTSDIERVAISPDGTRALTGGHDQLIHVFDFQSQREISPLKGHNAGVITSVAFSADSRLAVSASSDRSIIIWDMAGLKELSRLALPGDETPTAAIFSAEGRRVLAAGDNGGLALLSVDTGAVLLKTRGPAGHFGLAALPDGRVLTSDKDGVVRIWAPSTNK